MYASGGRREEAQDDHLEGEPDHRNLHQRHPATQQREAQGHEETVSRLLGYLEW